MFDSHGLALYIFVLRAHSKTNIFSILQPAMLVVGLVNVDVLHRESLCYWLRATLEIYVAMS